MRFGRFIFEDHEVFGYVNEEHEVFVVRPEDREALQKEKFLISEAAILPPVIPTKIICVGLNYKKHAEEMGKPIPDEPMIFMKPATALIGPGQPILLPPQSTQVEYEGELAVAIGRRARNISSDEAKDAVLGYTILNDVTARDLQKKDVQYTRAKSFDSFAPVGPFLATEIDPMNLRLQTFVNGICKQDTSTSDMIFGVYDLIAFVSSVMTLLPGDIISTGTPSGVGPLEADDNVTVEIEQIGRLTNPVRRA